MKREKEKQNLKKDASEFWDKFMWSNIFAVIIPEVG